MQLRDNIEALQQKHRVAELCWYDAERKASSERKKAHCRIMARTHGSFAKELKQALKQFEKETA